MTVVTRMLQPDEWEVFREVRLRALADAPDAFGATLAQALANPEAVWRDRVRGPGSTYVCELGGDVVAMGGVFTPPDSDVAMIWGMWTAPEARGQGCATALLSTLVARSRELGRTVELDVTEGNDAARALYVAYGFVPTGEWQPLREGSTLRCEAMRLAE